jgi:hypothetical protein
MVHCGKIFQKNFEKFRKKVDRLSASRRSLTQGKRRKKSRTLHRPMLPYTGAKFFYLQEARKICLTLHTGANFSIFVKKNWKNSESHSNGPREGVSPNDDEMGLEKRVSPNDDRNGP